MCDPQDFEGLASENAELRQQLTHLRFDFNTMKQDLESLKIQVYANSQSPAFGTLASVNGALTNGLLENGFAISNPQRPASSPQPLMDHRLGPETVLSQPRQHQFGAFSVLNAAPKREMKEGFVIIGGHDGSWLSSCCTYIPGEGFHLPQG